MTGPTRRFNGRFAGRGREAGIATAGAVVVLLAGTTIGVRQSTTVWPTAVARMQPFAETIVETGTLGSQQMMLYASSIPAAPAKIVEIAAEGAAVRPGDLLLRFDVTRFEQTREADRAALQQAEGEFARAVEEARLELLRAQGDIEASSQQIANAERGLTNQVEGKGRVAMVEAEVTLAEAQREAARARTNVEDLKPLLAEILITRTEFERAEQALRHAADQERLAASRRDSLLRYERPAATSRAQAELNAAREGLTRQGETVVARAAQRRASIMVAKSRADEIRTRIAMLTDQIDHAAVRAQGPGLVVYRDLFFGTDRRKPQIGDEVFPNQPIIALPDSSQLTVETRIREVDLHKVSASQRVQVRVDAYPDLRLPAAVSMIGALAEEDASRAGTKFFPVTVKVSLSDPRLRTGMTARVEIEVSSLPSAVVIPVQAVFEDQGVRYVVITRNGQPERRTVTIAAENESLAAIASGVAAGDAVLLVDPTTPSSVR
jgi:HlyD family secretion protein